MAPSSCIELTRSERQLLLGIARSSIVQGLDTNKPLQPDPARLPPAMLDRLGSFVTLMQNEVLRGCVGSVAAKYSLAHGIAVSAFHAAFRDPRFPGLSASEIRHTRIEISILSVPQLIEAASNEDLLTQLHPQEDGLVLNDGAHHATFLPKVWQDLPDPQHFVRHLKAKAGLAGDHWSASIRFHRYRTVTFAERGAEIPAPA